MSLSCRSLFSYRGRLFCLHAMPGGALFSYWLPPQSLCWLHGMGGYALFSYRASPLLPRIFLRNSRRCRPVGKVGCSDNSKDRY